MQSLFTLVLFSILALSFSTPLVAQLEDPPETIVDGIRDDRPTVTRAYFDGDVALYLGGALTLEETQWMIEPIRTTWLYMQETYGDFGPDPRMYVVVHENDLYRTATINTRFDAGMGYRNTINLGGAWNWRDSTARVNYEVFIHELSHIVEGGNNNVKESPSFRFWNDGPWPAIFIYDVYVNAFQDSTLAKNWFDVQVENTTPHRAGGGDGQYYFFRDWFYPLWRDNGGGAFFDRYFKALSNHFRTIPIDDPNVPDSIPTSASRASFGEILYFSNLASGTDNKELFTNAFGWNDDREEELYNARYLYDLPEAGDTIDFPDFEDITADTLGVISSQYPAEQSPAGEQLVNLFDDSYQTKYLTFNSSTWVQFSSDKEYAVSGYTITSANDAPGRDPISWNLQGSNDGETWATIDERTDEDFITRYYQRLFTFDNTDEYSYYRFNIDTVASTIVQIAEIELFTTEKSVSTREGRVVQTLDFNIYPNPASSRLYVDRVGQYRAPEVRVFSSLGQQVLHFTGNLGNGIDISALPNGTYTVQLEDQARAGVRKFIKH